MAACAPKAGAATGRARARSLVACVLLLATLGAAAATTPPLKHPHPPTCIVSVAPAPGGAWTTAAGELVAAWELGVSAASHTPAPWRLGVTARADQVSGVLTAWNLDGVKVGAGRNTSSTLTVTGEAPAAWQALPGGGGGQAAARVGLVVSLGSAASEASDTNAFLPASATLNGAACKVVAGPPQTAVVVSEEADAATPVSDAQPPRGLTTRNGEIIGPDGKPLFFVGVNWFGYDCGATMVDGLWGGSSAIAKDFPTIVWRLKLLGFNAVRLPFSFDDLWGKAPKQLATSCAGVSPDAVVAATTAPVGTPASGGYSALPPPSSAPGPGAGALASQGMGGACNAAVPGPGGTAPYVSGRAATTLDRFLWTAGYFAGQGFFLMLDNQFNLDQSVLRDPGLWLARWTELGRRLVREHPAAAAVTMIDILNEPDAWGLAWEARNGKPGTGDLYLAAMDALHAVYPGFLYVIEGCGQAGLAKNWGDGLATDPALIAARGLSNPRPFFTALLDKPYLNQVVAGPHIYGPSVARTQADMTGPSLYSRLSSSFGYLNKDGFRADDGRTHRFPVLIGETGTGFLAWSDMQPQMDMAAWAMAGRPGTPPNQAADDGRHNPVSGVFWWAWNANGEGSMGVVQSDWTAVDWNKVTWMEHVGARPWWFGSAATGAGADAVEGGDAAGGAGDDGGVLVPPVPRTAAEARAAASGAAARDSTNTSAVPSPPSLAFSGDLWEWGLASGRLELGGSTAAAPPPPPPPPPRPASSEEQGAGDHRALSTAGALILGDAGVPVDLVAVSWPGFGWDAVRGSGDPGVLGTDVSAALARTAALGFNAVKLPLDLGGVLAPGPAAPPLPARPCPGTGAGEGALADATRPPTVAPSDWITWPSLPAAPNASDASASAAEDACNPYLPTASTLARLVGLARLVAASGLYVILEDASGPRGAGLAGLGGGGGGGGDAEAWVEAWARVGAAVAPAAAGRLAIRLAADPDVAGVGWAPRVAPPLGPGAAADAAPPPSPHPGLGALLLGAMDALDAAAPGALFLVPGAGQAAGMGGITGAGYGRAVAAGRADAAAAEAQAAAGRAFLAALAARPYADRAVISPAWQVPSSRAGGRGARPLDPGTEWAALEAGWGYLSARRPPPASSAAAAGAAAAAAATRRFPAMLGAFGGPPPPAQLVQATAAEVEVGDGASAAASADAAALAALAAWLQPGCGLPACAAAAAAATGAADGGPIHAPVRSWAWDAWMAAGGGREAAAAASTHAITVALPAGAASTAAAALPPIDWGVTAFLEGLGAVPWFAPPTPEWRGAPPPGPAPAAVLPPLDDGSGGDAGEGATCVATVAVRAAGLVHGTGARAVGLVSLTLTPGTGPRPATSTAPPLTLIARPPAGGAYAALRALAGAVDGALAPGGGALLASVADPWASLWPGSGSGRAAVSVVALLEADVAAGADGVAGPDLAAALAPGSVSVAGRACRVEVAARAEGEVGGAEAVPSLMQVVAMPAA